MKVYGWCWRSNKRINVDWLGRYAPSPAGYALVVAAPGATDRRQPSAVGCAVTEYRNVASTQTMQTMNDGVRSFHNALSVDETWRAEGEVEEPAIAGRRPGEAGDASRRKVIVEAVSHRVGVRRCGRRTNRGVITCRVMRVHFGDTMAEMHHEHSDTPGYFLANLCVPGSDR